MLFPPGPEQPTAPNAGILRLEPGARHPGHDDGFAQVWFIVKGEFTIDRRLPAGHDALPPRPAFRGRAPHRDRRRDPDRAVSRPVDRRAADLCWAVQYGKAEDGRRGASP
jgi:hypothetical protein